MKSQLKTRREGYTGAYAGLVNKIAISNNSKPVDNKEILLFAEKTRDDFYKQTSAVINEIVGETKGC